VCTAGRTTSSANGHRCVMSLMSTKYFTPSILVTFELQFDLSDNDSDVSMFD